MNENRCKVIILISLICIFVLSFFIRYWIYNNSKNSEFVPFSNVCAFHYYFTARIASGEKIAFLDYRVQYPEGLAVFKHTSIFTEYVVGYLYQLLRPYGVSLDTWVRFFVQFWGTLPVFAVYLIAHKLTSNKLSAFISAAFYACAPAAINRTLGFGFLRENFALPVIFFHLVFVVFYLRQRKQYYAFLAGLLLFIALASWHFTEFYLLLFIIFVLIGFLKGKRQEDLMTLFYWLTGWSVLAGMIVPYLRANYFVLSAPMIICYALIITKLFIARYRTAQSGHHTIYIFGAILVLILTAGHPYISQQGAYTHVWNLGLYHLRYLAGKPEDPSRLPFSAKILWDVLHSSPSFREVIINFGILILVSAIPVILALKNTLRGGTDKAEELMIYFVLIFMALYLFINRLMVFWVFFLAIYAGRMVLSNLSSKIKIVVSTFIVLFLLLQAISTAASRVVICGVNYVVDMLAWIRYNTKPDDVVLSSPRSSPEILAYTGRPIVLHAKLESKQIRDKTKEWAESLFAKSEDKLYKLCRKWNVTWFVFPVGTYTNTGPSSWRYITNNLKEDKNTIGYKLEALPLKEQEDIFSFRGAHYKVKVQTGFYQPNLHHFRLFYRNRYFNIYKIE